MQVEYRESEGLDRPVGVVQAVLCESVDIGEVDDKFAPGKKKHECVLVWQLAESAGTYLNKEGKKCQFIQSKIYRVSLNEKANLRKIVEGMLGKPIPGLKDKKVVDISKLNGINCMLTISKPEDSNYTKIDAAAPIMKGLSPIQITNYTRPAWIDVMIAERKAGISTAEEHTDAADVSQDVKDFAATL